VSKVLVQIGRSKSRSQQQSIEAWVNDLKLGWSDGEGKFLTSFKDGKLRNATWYMCSVDLQPADLLKISVKTFIPNVGKDEELTFDSIYTSDDSLPVKEVCLSKVGMRGYPLVKGKVSNVATVSEDDKRKQDIEDFLNEGF
jgi:hypothetical protein